MYAAIGFDQIFIRSNVWHGLLNGRLYSEDRIGHDVEALQALMRDVHKLGQQQRRYFAVFPPQIGHAPWPDIVHGGMETSLAKRARALLVLQDEWLGQIVEQLSQDGRLNHTIIVVTGDHGVRTAIEDPSFEPYGILTDCTFRVPLLIYAPGVLKGGDNTRCDFTYRPGAYRARSVRDQTGPRV
jgi:phosphoglycerol transferase MdoB-like AlkP superfamily enzyme